MGYARRKPNTGNPSVRIDEEGEVESPLLYSTFHPMLFMSYVYLKTAGLLAQTGLESEHAFAVIAAFALLVVNIVPGVALAFMKRRDC